MMTGNLSKVTNNQSDNHQQVISPFCPQNIIFFEIILNRYFLLSFILLGIALNLTCVIIFSKILYKCSHSGHMYKFLLLKSICDFFYFSFLIYNAMVLVIYQNGNLQVTYSFATAIWY